MKKQLLFGAALVIGVSAIAQQANHLTPLAKQNQPLNKHIALTGAESKKANTNVTAKAALPKASMLPNVTQIGETQYDLQTNSSVGHRIINHADGTISAIWTICDGASPYTNRGVGYNYFDGTSWLLPDSTHIVQSRYDAIRTGFPDLGYLRNASDFVIKHETAGYTLYADSNLVKGDTLVQATAPFVKPKMTSWQTDAGVPLPPTNRGAIWPRVAIGGANGDVVHVIANYSDTTNILNGVKQPMVYSRSTDGGQNFSIAGSTLPGYSSSVTLYGGGENYAIDARGTNVAIVNGGIGEHVTLWKSSNDGTTFNRVLVDSFPYVPENNGTPVGYDSVPTNDGSVAVALDVSGKAHVAYGYTESGLDGTGASVYRPGTIGLIYWNENTQTKINIPITLGAVDEDGSGTYELGTVLTNTNTCRYGNNAVLHKPSIGFDASGAIYIVFSMPHDNDLTSDDQVFRHIWGVASYDGGATWTDAIDMTPGVFGEEQSFPVLARNVDNFLHIVYQLDGEPGTALTNGDADGLNQIMYMKVDKNMFAVGIKEENKASFTVGQNYPNPFNGTTTFSVGLTKNTNVSINVTDLSGKQVLNAQNYSNQVPGIHTYAIDGSKLSAGIYFYTVTCGAERVTKKFIVE